MNSRTRGKRKKELKMKRCKYCRDTENLTIDHKHPIILGGTNEIRNLQCLCKKCNGIKSDIPNKVFRRIMRYGIFIVEKRGKITLNNLHKD